MTRTIYDAAANEMEQLLIENNIEYTRKPIYEGWQFYIQALTGTLFVISTVMAAMTDYGSLWALIGMI